MKFEKKFRDVKSMSEADCIQLAFGSKLMGESWDAVRALELLLMKPNISNSKGIHFQLGATYYNLHIQGNDKIPSEVQRVLISDQETMGVSKNYENPEGVSLEVGMLNASSKKLYDSFETLPWALLHIKESDTVYSDDKNEATIARIITIDAATKNNMCGLVAKSCYYKNIPFSL